MEKIKKIQFTNEYGLKDTWTYKVNKIAEHFATLQENNNGSTKTSQARARKAAGEIKKLITPYKKANMAEVK